MSATTTSANIFPLRPRDHEDAERLAITWLAERHRKGWRIAFENLLDDWQPEVTEGGLREINSYLLGSDGPYLTPRQKAWIIQLRERPLRLYRG